MKTTNKRIIAAVLVALMCAVLTIPSLAVSGSYVYDMTDVRLDKDEISGLNKLASELYDIYGVEAYFVFAGETDDFDSYTDQVFDSVDASDNSVMLIIDENQGSYCFRQGSAFTGTTEQDYSAMWDAYYSGTTYYDGVEAYINVVANITGKELLLDGDSHSTSLGMIGNDASSQSYNRVNDEAGLLDRSDADKLGDKLDEISQRQKCDVIVVTVDSLGGKSPRDFADDYYDYNGFGFGSSHDGILLLLAMDSRDWYITTTGFGIKAITDKGREYISEQFLPDLSDGNYYLAFETYAEYCDSFITQAKTGDAYDIGNMPDSEDDTLIMIPVLIIVGALLAFIPVSIMKHKLKTVAMQSAASEYVKPGSLNITESRDMFLYAHIDRRRKPEANSGGSSTHIGSSGTTHGGGGGRF